MEPTEGNLAKFWIFIIWYKEYLTSIKKKNTKGEGRRRKGLTYIILTKKFNLSDILYQMFVDLKYLKTNGDFAIY